MNIFKFFLSLALTIVMLLLMDPRSFYGISFHEWAGLIILRKSWGPEVGAPQAARGTRGPVRVLWRDTVGSVESP